MDFFQALSSELTNNCRCVLMYVIHSNGSSPGRQGFKMFVSSSGLIFSSIGGGFMEHKWVEYCKSELLAKDFKPFIKRQIHQKEAKDLKSGLICSGEQTIAFYSLTNKDLLLVNSINEAIESKQFGTFVLNEKSIEFNPNQKEAQRFSLQLSDDYSTWLLKEDLGNLPELYIAGGGHVSLALSNLAVQLGFKVHVLDNRKNLNTIELNVNANHYYLNDYTKTYELIPSGTNTYVVLMSFGFITDKTILKSLLPYQYKYLGMMGSKEKVRQLFAELRDEGISEEKLEAIYTPIGLQIHSKTPEEIAISILAEIIKLRNAD